MKAQDRDATARRQAAREMAEKRIQGAKLIIHRDTQCLKNPPHSVVVGPAGRHCGGELERRLRSGGEDGSRKRRRERLVRIFDEQRRELSLVDAGEQRARGLTALRDSCADRAGHRV